MSELTKEGWYRLTLPDGWEADEDEAPVAIYNPQGVGALQLTAESPKARKAGDRIDVFLMMRAFLQRVGVDVDEASSRRESKNGLEWATTEYEADSPEGRVFWRLWFATNHDVLAFLTYACPAEDREVERRAVDEVVDSLVLF